jgi:hypothetical protein
MDLACEIRPLVVAEKSLKNVPVCLQVMAPQQRSVFTSGLVSEMSTKHMCLFLLLFE